MKFKFFKRKFLLLFCCLIFFAHLPAKSKIRSTFDENKKNLGKLIDKEIYNDDKESFAGRVFYKLLNSDWNVEVLYKDNLSYSETARPTSSSTKKIIQQAEANIIADTLFPVAIRGPYKKMVKNAKFISHFFNNGVVSFEMQLDKRGKNHIGIIGVRTILYSDGDTFSKIKINAYQ